MYDDTNFEKDKPGGNIWLYFHVLSLIIALCKVGGGFETLPWWFIFLPFIIDAMVMLFIAIVIGTLFFVTSRFGQKK